MQRILQSGEIETLDRTHFQRIVLPNPASLFAERAARVRQLAEGNPIADYLHFMAKIIDAQHAAAATLSTAPLDAAVLGVNDFGHEVQVVGNRVALGQLAHARGALGKYAGGVRQQNARKVGAVDGFDFAGLKNALHGVS